MADCAARRTCSGIGVSHTPCDRLIPPTRSHSIDMFRISDCAMNAERLLRRSDMADPRSALEEAADGADRRVHVLGGGLGAHGKREHLAAERLGLGHGVLA